MESRQFGRFTRIFLAIYLVEAGALLVIGPWTSWWDRNFFADLVPWLNSMMERDTVRVAVAATGGMTAVAGVADLRAALRRWGTGAERRTADATPEP